MKTTDITAFRNSPEGIAFKAWAMTGSASSDTPENLALMEIIDCMCDAAWSHDKDDLTHYSARLLIFVENIERKRDKALAALSAIDERYIDGHDTYEDWHFMGKTARDFLSENSEDGEPQRDG